MLRRRNQPGGGPRHTSVSPGEGGGHRRHRRCGRRGVDWMTTFHDPRAEVEKIREHLGSHDGRLAFLIGAGTSAAVLDADKEPLIPTVAALSDTCRGAVATLGDEHAEAYDTIRAQCD